MNEQQPSNTNDDITTTDDTVKPTTISEPVIETNLCDTVCNGSKKVLIRNYAIAALVIGLMGSGLWLVLESQGRVQTNFLGTFTNRGPVAVVNGTKISRQDYNTNRLQVEGSAVVQGADVTDPSVISQINTQAIETLVNTELLRQKAKELDITVAEEEVDARYNEIVEQVGGEELLATKMAELGITNEGLLRDIKDELFIQKLFDQEINTDNIEVTEEEITQVFSQVSAQSDTTPTLDDETREIIKTNIQLSKEQTAITEYIQSLRTEANIEIKI